MSLQKTDVVILTRWSDGEARISYFEYTTFDEAERHCKKLMHKCRHIEHTIVSGRTNRIGRERDVVAWIGRSLKTGDPFTEHVWAEDLEHPGRIFEYF